MVDQDVGGSTKIEAKARNNLLCYHGSTHRVPPLDQDHLVAGLRQVRGANKCVVPCAYEDDIAVSHP